MVRLPAEEVSLGFLATGDCTPVSRGLIALLRSQADMLATRQSLCWAQAVAVDFGARLRDKQRCSWIDPIRSLGACGATGEIRRCGVPQACKCSLGTARDPRGLLVLRCLQRLEPSFCSSVNCEE